MSTNNLLDAVTDWTSLHGMNTAGAAPHRHHGDAEPGGTDHDVEDVPVVNRDETAADRPGREAEALPVGQVLYVKRAGEIPPATGARDKATKPEPDAACEREPKRSQQGR